MAVVPPGGTANGGPVAVVAGPELPLAEGESTGLVFRLQPGRAEATKAPAAHQVTGKPLTAAEADKLLAKLPALPKTASLATSFAKRPSSSPPPSAFDVTLQEFPQSSTTKAEKPAVQPLAVLRAVPNGDVPFAPELTVTFNQPMIALDSHDATVAKGVPVKLTPEPKGKWRWLGSRTLAFSPEQRFPMATEYRVEVTAGTAAPSGAKLAQTFTQAFRTPPAQQEANSLRDTVPTSTLPVVAV
ncbi:MAG TPA: Ig-like domain-containing protein, partial [Polyangiales bacterium]|nr:Ig-like domain-containing protein [Polyangiales bacterium]